MSTAGRKYYCGGSRLDPKVCTYESERRWLGRCPGCGRFYDIVRTAPKNEDRSRNSLATLATLAPPEKLTTGIAEWDKVLGGGIVPGNSILITGPPGTGKSTILLQTANAVATEKKPVLYTSGEQSRDDIALLASRLGMKNPYVNVMGNEGDVYKIIAEAEQYKPGLLVIDSINTAYMDDVDADVNSARQLEAVSNYVTSFGKSEKVASIIVLHVNKDGSMSGPRVVEHLVDSVMFFDPFEPTDEEDLDLYTPEEIASLRVLTSGKNRNGPTGLKEVVEMTQSGLRTPNKRKSRLFMP